MDLREKTREGGDRERSVAHTKNVHEKSFNRQRGLYENPRERGWGFRKSKKAVNPVTECILTDI